VVTIKIAPLAREGGHWRKGEVARGDEYLPFRRRGVVDTLAKEGGLSPLGRKWG